MCRLIARTIGFNFISGEPPTMKAEVAIKTTGSAILRLIPESEGDWLTLALLKEVDEFAVRWDMLAPEDRQP